MSEKIDINMADAETLAMISGIGAVLAERIIEYRQTVHPFEEVIELAAVPGISEKMVRGFEDLVTVQPVSQSMAVSPNLDEPEEIHLLAAPEELELLTAPEELELLTAGLPDTPPAVEEIEIAETEPAEATSESEEVAEDVAPVVADDPISEPEPEAEPDVEIEMEPAWETAVSPPRSPEIEDLALSDPDGEPMLDPDLEAGLSARQNTEWEAKAQRRGCLNTLLGATFGAILGAVLTLAILAALNNGTLSFSASDTEIRQQLDTEIISRTNELNQLSTRVSLVATEEAATNQTLQDDLTSANEALSEEIANNEEIISYLATRSGDLELRLQEVAGAADTFTGFLDGLRGLLNDLEEGTATPTPAAEEETITPTPTPTSFGSNTPTTEATATTAVSPTGAPTRTPLPTATPFTFPTNTPAPQP